MFVRGPGVCMDREHVEGFYCVCITNRALMIRTLYYYNANTKVLFIYDLCHFHQMLQLFDSKREQKIKAAHVANCWFLQMFTCLFIAVYYLIFKRLFKL